MQIVAPILSLFASSILLISPAAADENPAILSIIDTHTVLEELCHSFYSMKRATGHLNAPIVVFVAIPLDDNQKSTLSACTERTVYYDDVTDFYADIPNGVQVQEGANYDYQQTQRFLESYVWDRVVLEPYDVLMYITDKTCLSFDVPDLPGFPAGTPLLNYKSYSIPGLLEVTKHSVGLFEDTFDYMSTKGLTAVNPELFDQIVLSHVQENKLPKFTDDFEIVRKSFMQSAGVRAYHLHITESLHSVGESFHRLWPCGCVMYMTMAMFATADSVSTVHIPGIVEKNLWTGNYFPNICREKIA